MYSFKDRSVGEVLRAFAMLKNAVVTIGSDDILYFVNRDGLEKLSVKTPINYEFEAVKRNEVPEISEEIILNDYIKDKILTYYKNYMAGTFHNYKFQFFINEFYSERIPDHLQGA
jgi:hypothetical protein